MTTKRIPKIKAPPHEVERSKRDNADQILAEWRKGSGEKNLLSQLFPGPDWAGRRAEIIARGVIHNPKSGAALYVQTQPIDGTDEHVVVHVAAAVERDPGLTRDLITSIQDFLPTVELPNIVRTRQNWMIYRNENIINNAVNKYAALVSTGGRFKVKYAKQGKTRDAVDRLQAALDEFYYNVNTAPLDGVVTAQRGLKLLQHSAVRQCLVEGDWIGRTVWSKHKVGTYGVFSLPMTIQSITLTYIEDIPALAGTGIEAFYWVPNTTLVQQVTNPTDKNVAQMLKRFFPADILSQLKKNGKAFLDPALLLHVKHRQVYENSFGESFITSVQFAIAYKRAVEALDLVSMQSLINRLQIIMVGSSDPNSPYAKPEVAQQRAALLQNFFNDPGPYMTLIWQGDDIKVEDVSAHNAILDLNGRHNLADGKIKMGLGMPDSLLTGTAQGSDGKAAGWAAAIGAAATADELKTQFEQCWTTLGERIAEENHFDEYQVIYESDSSLMLDKDAEWNQIRNDYLAGMTTIEDYLISRNRDPGVAFDRMCYEKGLDPDTATWAQAFSPPQGLPGQGVSGVGGPARTVHVDPTITIPKEPEGAPGPDGKNGDGTPAVAPVAPPPGTAPDKSPNKGRTPNKQLGKPPQAPKGRGKKPVENK